MQGHKQDWVSGVLAIPDFHCPRCRDHWYGLSAFPCDEELARLIREGKWYIGKENGKGERETSTTNRERNKEDKEMTSGSSDSINLPGIQKRKGTGFQINKSEHHIDFVTPEAREKKKKKNRISFKLDNEDGNFGNNSSNTSLEGGDERRGRYGQKNKDSNGLSRGDTQSNNGGDDEGAKRNGDTSAYDVNSGSSATLLSRVDGDSDSKRLAANERNGSESTDTGGGGGLGRKKRKVGGNGSSTDLDGGLHGFGGSDGNNSKSSGKRDKDNDDGLGGKNRSKLSTGEDGRDQWGLEGNRNDGENNGDQTRGRDNERNGVNNDGDKDGDGRVDGREGGGRGRKNGRQGDSLTSSQRGSRSSLHGGGSQHWASGRDEKERELIKGKGYMRASSPSQSEWGDPTHARTWASNTASSSRVSLASSTSHRHKDSKRDEKEREISLPPIINRKKENPFGSLSFMEGFELTRAFTFSYY